MIFFLPCSLRSFPICDNSHFYPEPGHTDFSLHRRWIHEQWITCTVISPDDKESPYEKIIANAKRNVRKGSFVFELCVGFLRSVVSTGHPVCDLSFCIELRWALRFVADFSKSARPLMASFIGPTVGDKHEHVSHTSDHKQCSGNRHWRRIWGGKGSEKPVRKWGREKDTEKIEREREREDLRTS